MDAQVDQPLDPALLRRRRLRQLAAIAGAGLALLAAAWPRRES
jgi:hypothetical protein